MLNLPTSSTQLQLVTGAGVASIEVHASWVDLTTANVVTPGATDSTITAATTTVIVAPPAANTDRNVKFLSVQNTSVSNCAVTIQHFNGASAVNLFSMVLLPGYTIQYNSDGNGFVVYDAAGDILVSCTQRGIVGVSAGTQTATSGTVVFSNSNGITFGMSASSVVTASFLGAADINLSAGTTSNLSSAFTFADSNGVAFGLDAGTITASVSGVVGTVSVFSQDADFVTNFPAGLGSMSIGKLSLAMNLSATQLALIANFSGASNASDAVTISHAVYTLNAGTASLASTASRVISWTSGSATTASSEYGGASGTRYRTLSASYAMTPGDYVFAWWISTANGVAVDVFGRAAMNLVGTFDGVETATFLPGLSASSVAAFPVSFAATDTGYVRTGFSALRQPGAILFGTN